MQSICTIKINFADSTMMEKSEKEKLGSPMVVDRQQLTNVIKNYQKHLVTAEGETAICKSTIDVEFKSKEVSNITITDLPGIMNTLGQNETEESREAIDLLIENTMKNNRCVILAILPANNNFRNSQVLQRALKFDEDTQRTFPVITKVDLIDEGAEVGVVQLAKGGMTATR